MSETIASSILRMFSACRASRGVQVQFSEFRNTVDAARDFGAEPLLDVLDGDTRVFYDIMEEAGLQGHDDPIASPPESGPR